MLIKVKSFHCLLGFSSTPLGFSSTPSWMKFRESSQWDQRKGKLLFNILNFLLIPEARFYHTFILFPFRSY
jgi:hypothetical protein